MQLLQSPKLWSQIAKLRGNKPVIAAIAYANEDHLSLRSKDVLICDASDSRIATGATTYALLSELAKRKVELWHLEKLHAKVVRLHQHVVVGSANMTTNAKSLFEAALLTDEPEALQQVDDMLKALLKGGRVTRIDQAFLKRIKAIPVVASGRAGGARKTKVRLPARQPMAWMMGYRELSDREQAKSDPLVATAMQAEEAPPYFRTTLKAAASRPAVQRGDQLIFVHLSKHRVRRPVTVSSVVECGEHLFYVHDEVANGGIEWTRVQTKLKSLGLNRHAIPAQLGLTDELASAVQAMFRAPKR